MFRAHSARSHFLFLFLGTVVPLAAVTAAALFYLARAEFRSAQRGLQDTASALSAAVDREILSSITTLQALASSEFIDQQNLRELHKMAIRVLPTQPGWRAIILHDPEGNNVFHSSFAFGTRRPKVTDPESFARVTNTLRPTVMDYTYGPVSGATLGTRVPVLRAGKLLYVISATVDASRLDQILKQQKLPNGWYGVVFDGQRKQIASSLADSQSRRGDNTGPLIGKFPADSDAAWLVGPSREGVDSYGAFRKAPITAYYVGIIVPRSELTRTLLQSIWIVFGVSLLALTMTLFALRYGRRLKAGTQYLVEIARNIATARPSQSVASNSIEEINLIARAMIEASNSLEASNSERDKYEAALRESERRATAANQRLQAIADKMAVAVTRCSRDLRYLWVSRQYADWLGLDYSQIAGKPIADVIGQRALNAMRSFVERVLQGEEVSYEALVDFRNGKRWIHAVYRPTYDAGGSVDGWIAAVFDITDTKAIEEELRASEERFRVMFALAAVGQAQLDLATGKFIDVNEKFCAITGYSESELLSMAPAELTHRDDRGCDQEKSDQLFLGKIDGYTSEKRYVRKDGTVIWVSVSVKLMRNRSGDPVCTVGAIDDITQRKEMEREIREADRRKDEFIAMLSHELRNPLAPISNAVQILRTLGPADPKLIWCRDLIERQVALMSRLMEDLLDVSRITRNQLRLRKEPMDLRDALRNAIQTSQPIIDASGHKLIVDLPDSAIPMVADGARLTQVFSNLLNNAAKYMENAGEIRLTACFDGITSGAEKNHCEKVVMVSIKDSGIGIAAREMPRLFEMFSQAESSIKRSQGGLGIGLSLVKGLVELHGGSVTAVSEGLGQGSEFIVRLPVSNDAPEAIAGVERPTEAATLPNKRALVVDDNQNQTQSMAMLLELLGMTVRVAKDGPSAIQAVRDFAPDVALIDIGLPGMNGYQLARLIRTLPETGNMKLIAQTGWGRDEDRQRAKEAGFDYHLTKPIDHKVLESILAESLG